VADRPERRSALADAAPPRVPEGGAVSVVLGERRGLAIAHFAAVGKARVPRALRERLGVAVPAAPGHAAEGEGRTVLWQGPGRWWLVSARDEPGALLEQLRRALPERDFAVTDQSHGWACLRVAGPAARELLAQGCPLDLSTPAFAPGCCANSELRGVSIVLHAADDAPTFHLYAQRSLVASVWEWFADGAIPLGCRLEAAPGA